jgi:hypothetical protein
VCIWPFWSDINIRPPLGLGMTFLDSDTCAEGGGVYLFMPGFSSLYDAIHGWMMGRMDGWMESFILSMTSFIICNESKGY